MSMAQALLCRNGRMAQIVFLNPSNIRTFQKRREAMKNIKRIMVAIDLSDYSQKTLEYAVDLAAELKADLVIVNVINQRDIDAYTRIAQMNSAFTGEDFIRMRERERSKRIQELVEKCNCHDVPIKTVFRTGVPFRELTKAIKKEGADLLVMGTRGRSNLRGVLLGSTAEKTIRRSPVPVLSLRSRGQERALEDRERESWPQDGKVGV
ncbi:MAG TPA: universal stress protein [Desulfobacteraceae bacterium]|nr:MAG: universal stress protein [Deltaproteobacteria bacterium]HDZ24785.1 universal stress protein [Desulfobacteraceae bacterium]